MTLSPFLKVAAVLSFVFFALGLQMNAQWETSSFSGLHESVAIFDDQTFGVVEANGSKFTSNGGTSFVEYDLVDLNNTPLLGFIPTDLEYVDETTLLCSGFFIGNDLEGILKSVNGGQNWNFTYQNTIIDGNLQLNDMHLAGGGVAYAVGRNGRFLKTVNNGDSWTEIPIDTTHELFQVFAFSEDVIGIGGANGIFQTIDGGESWNTFGSSSPVRGIWYKDENTIMACSSTNRVFFTDDGGESWASNPLDIFDLADVVHIEGDEWLLAGYATYYRSSDNGTTWFIQDVPNGGNNQALVKKGDFYLGRRTNSIDWTASLPPVPMNFVSFTSIQNPSTVCAGASDLVLELSNLGANEVTSIAFEVAINNQFNETVTWNGSLLPGTINQQVVVSISTALSESAENYDLTITSVNGEGNNFPSFANEEIQLSVNGFSGSFTIGTGGDYLDFTAFKTATDFKVLCGDLQLLFEDGTYASDALTFDPATFNVSLETVNAENPQVTLQGGLSLIGFDEEGDSEMRIENITIEEGTEGQSALLTVSEATSLILRNVEVICEPGMTNTAILLNGIHTTTLENTTLVAEIRDLRINGSLGSLNQLSLTECTFSSGSTAILIESYINRIEIYNSTIETNVSILELTSVSFMEVFNNTFVRTNSVATMFEAAGPGNTTLDECFIQIENNTFVAGGGKMLQASGNVQIRNNIFHAPQGGGGITSVQIETPFFVEGQFINFTNNVLNANEGSIGPLLQSIPQNSDVTIDYNAYYSTFNNAFGQGTGNNLEDEFEAWKAFSSYDENSILHNTQFVAGDLGRPINGGFNAPIIDVSPLPSLELDHDGVERVGPLYDLGAFEINGSSFDGGIEDVIASTQCFGEVDFYVVFTNFGNTLIENYELEWSVDGAVQGVLQISDPLEPLQFDTLFLGTLSLSEGSVTAISSSILSVNGGADDNATNDLFNLVFEPLPFPAEMHIGEGQDYLLASDALDVLIENGMCGPVDFVFHPGVHEIFFENYIYPEEFVSYPLTFRSLSGEYTDTQIIGVGGGGLRLEQFMDVRFEALNILGPQYPAISLFGKLNSVELINCRFENILFLNGEDDGPAREYVKITNCLFQSAEGGGMAFRNFGNSPIDLFLFENNVVDTDLDVFAFWGIDVTNAFNAHIRDNRFVTKNGPAITLTECHNSIIERNHIEGNEYEGIDFVHGDVVGDHVVRNNFFLGSDQFRAIRIAGSFVPNHLIVHNTIRGGFEGVTVINAKAEIYNNVLDGSYAPFYVSAVSIAESSINGNVYSVEASDVAIRIDATPISLADFQLEYAQDLASVQQLVLFEDEETYLTNDPLLDGSIEEIALTGYAEVDILGVERDALTPDVGCYEFSSTLAPRNLTLEAVTVATDFCEGPTTAEIEVTNNGTDEITSFHVTLTLANSTTSYAWEGNLLPEETTSVTIEGVEIFVDGPLTGMAVIDLVNEEEDNLPEDNELEVQFEGHALSGLIFIGESPLADFQNLETFLEGINQFGFCGDLNVLVLPGTYQFPIDFVLNDDFVHVKSFGSLNQDPTTVIIESESDVWLEGFNQWDFKDVTFRANGNFRTHVKDAFSTSFTNCHFESNSFPALDITESSAIALDQCELNESLSLFDIIDFSFTNSTLINGGIQSEDVRNFTLINNEITNDSNELYAAGVNLIGNSTDFDMQRNSITGNFDRGVNMNVSCNCDGTQTRQMINNIIDHTGVEMGIYLNETAYFDVYHNTVLSANAPALEVLNVGQNMRVDNNIFVSATTNAVTLLGAETIESFDNNVVFSTSTNAVLDFATIDELNESILINANDNVEADPQLLPFTYAVSNLDAAYTGKTLGILLDFEAEERDPTNPMSGAIEAFNLVQEPLPGDLNGDGVVDTADLLLVLGNWGCTEDCNGADADGDGVVSVGDLLIILQGYGG